MSSVLGVVTPDDLYPATIYSFDPDPIANFPQAVESDGVVGALLNSIRALQTHVDAGSAAQPILPNSGAEAVFSKVVGGDPPRPIGAAEFDGFCQRLMGLEDGLALGAGRVFA